MLVNCKSCLKKFVLPDSAISESGRLVQCGSCGNKWTQFPVKNIPIDEKKPIKSKPAIKATRPRKNLYSREYLKKKHGIDIHNTQIETKKKSSHDPNKESSFGFYSYVIFLFVFFATLISILNLTKEIIIVKFPALEVYINYLFEVIDIIKISLTEFINQFSV